MDELERLRAAILSGAAWGTPGVGMQPSAAAVLSDVTKGAEREEASHAVRHLKVWLERTRQRAEAAEQRVTDAAAQTKREVSALQRELAASRRESERAEANLQSALQERDSLRSTCRALASSASGLDVAKSTNADMAPSDHLPAPVAMRCSATAASSSSSAPGVEHKGPHAASKLASRAAPLAADSAGGEAEANENEHIAQETDPSVRAARAQGMERREVAEFIALDDGWEQRPSAQLLDAAAEGDLLSARHCLHSLQASLKLSADLVAELHGAPSPTNPPPDGEGGDGQNEEVDLDASVEALRLWLLRTAVSTTGEGGRAGPDNSSWSLSKAQQATRLLPSATAELEKLGGELAACK